MKQRRWLHGRKDRKEQRKEALRCRDVGNDEHDYEYRNGEEDDDDEDGNDIDDDDKVRETLN